MNKYLEVEVNSLEFKLENLSVETLDQMRIVAELSFDDISLEGDLFGALKDIGGKIANFFKNIFSFIKDFLNISKRLREFWDTNSQKDVKKSLNNFDKSTNKLDYSDVADLDIPVTLGFDTRLSPILKVLEGYSDEYVKDYSKYIDKFDLTISEFITNEASRATFTPNKDKKFTKTVERFDKSLMGVLNRRQKSSKSNIDKVYGNIDNVKNSLETLTKIYDAIPEKEFKDNLDSIEKLKSKLEAVYELIEVEKEPVSKQSLKDLIDEISLLANATTLLGKVGLVIYESSLMTVNTVRLFAEINNNK